MKFNKINKHFFPENEDVKQSYMYLHGEINHESTAPLIQEIIASNLELDCECENPEECECEEKDDVINILICSGGGEVPAAMSLIAIIEGSDIPIRTIALGECGSAALMILMAGHQRVVTPYSSILSHQFSSELGGSFSDIKSTMKEFHNYHEKLVRFYIERTGLSREEIEANLMKDTDTWLTPEEAVKFNVADVVLDLK